MLTSTVMFPSRPAGVTHDADVDDSTVAATTRSPKEQLAVVLRTKDCPVHNTSTPPLSVARLGVTARSTTSSWNWNKPRPTLAEELSAVMTSTVLVPGSKRAGEKQVTSDWLNHSAALRPSCEPWINRHCSRSCENPSPTIVTTVPPTTSPIEGFTDVSCISDMYVNIAPPVETKDRSLLPSTTSTGPCTVEVGAKHDSRSLLTLTATVILLPKTQYSGMEGTWPCVVMVTTVPPCSAP
eukprot:3939168-Rhodomonas_salina.1